MGKQQFTLYLIKPTRYDDDGYPLQWVRSIIPSNSLACLAGIADDSLSRGVLDEFDTRVIAIDEINTKVETSKIIQELKTDDTRGLVCLVGVQSNQFPRAVDLARPLREAGIPVCIGGFHPSGCLSMLDELPADLKEAQAMGISLFAGEAEDERFDEVLRNAAGDGLKPIYNHVNNTPNIAGSPIPILERQQLDKTIGQVASFDLGRGCPFECSFCTIINVQGRKSRFRTADDLEKIIRENAEIGITKFFLTDDNFLRNKMWEEFLDRIIALRDEGLRINMMIQVDTLAHKVKGFIEKCTLAGADQIFIGLENINSDSLEAVKKRQNRIEDYREMFLAWKKYPVFITCGYIIGFPNDSKESIISDIETLKRELPIDALYLNYLTPLPGSEDHLNMVKAGQWMDPDMNKYDLNHRVTHHQTMSDADWEEAYREAHARFYTWEHMETIFKRLVALKSNKRWTTLHRLLAYREAVRLEGVAKLEAGLFRIKRRKQRRYGMPAESILAFYPRYWLQLLRNNVALLVTYMRLRRLLRGAMTAPDRFDYVDDAIKPIDDRASTQEAVESLIDATRNTAYAKKRQERIFAKQ